MFNVICTLPNASHEISGIAFVAGEHEGAAAMVTPEPVSLEQAMIFDGIPGYVIADLTPPPAPAAKASRAPAPAAQTDTP